MSLQFESHVIVFLLTFSRQNVYLKNQPCYSYSSLRPKMQYTIKTADWSLELYRYQNIQGAEWFLNLF